MVYLLESDKPRKTKIAAFRLLSSLDVSDPMRCRNRFLGTAVTLSTMTRHAVRKPLRVVGGTGILKVGAGVGATRAK